MLLICMLSRTVPGTTVQSEGKIFCRLNALCHKSLLLQLEFDLKKPYYFKSASAYNQSGYNQSV